MDTIELLETIGSDASLRYVAADELQNVLTQTSVELAEAVASGNAALLRGELKLQQSTHVVVQTHAPGHDDDEDEGESPEPEQTPDRKPD